MASVTDVEMNEGVQEEKMIKSMEDVQLQVLNKDSAPAKYQIREPFPGYPHFAEAITSKENVQCGDHILFQVTEFPFRPKFHSALVVSVAEHIEIIMNSEEGVVKKLVPFHMLKTLHKIAYTAQLHNEVKAIERAESRLKNNEKCYHVLKNNGHFFVTWCITGREFSLTDILRTLENRYLMCKEDHLKPILYKFPITKQNLCPGDHVIDGAKHYLVESVNETSGTFSAYTLCEDSRAILVNKVSLSPAMVRIECDLYKSKAAQTLKIAEDKLTSRWKCPEHFVTAMKCGTEYSFYENHRFVIESNIVTSFTLLTPDLAIKEGDHLMIRDYRNPKSPHSVLVYTCPDHTRVSIKPQLESVDVIDLTLYPEVYRINYSDALPTSEALMRGKSKHGDAVLKSYPSDHSYFVMWAKTGQTKCVTIPADITSNIVCYEKVTSSGQVQVGDHLLQHLNDPPNQRHLMVIEYASNSKFKVIFFHQGNVQERVEELHGENYIIKYQSDLLLSTEDAIKRARNQIGQKYNPWDRMLFIMQAKLKEKNSSQGASISISTDGKSVLMSRQQPSTVCSLPISKSRIMCFKQVTCGDYIIKVPNNPLTRRNTSASHHYIVVSTDNSPTQCTVIESHSGKIVKSQCTIEPSTDSASKQPFFYYRINYEPGMCISPNDSIKRADEMIGRRSTIGNNKFVHYMKVGNEVEVSISKLPDERNHLQQLKLNSANHIPFLGQPHYSHPVISCDQISVGTHIIYKQGNAYPPLYRSALIVDIIQQSRASQNEKVLELITNTLRNEFIRQSVQYSQLQRISKVVYLSSNFSEEEAVTRAKHHVHYHENFYHPEYYNSHHFVTMCKTGCEYSLTDILTRKQVEDYEEMNQKTNEDLKLKPVLFKVLVKDLADVNPADHIMIEGEHYLVKSTCIENGEFSAYTVIESPLPFRKNPVSLVTKKWKLNLSESVMAYKIDYSLQQERYHESRETLERAEEERVNGSKWKRSEGFVTKIKCDTEHFFDDRCLISDDVHIVSCTEVTPCISINEGDHLILLNQKTRTKHQSVLVYKRTDRATVDIMPPLNLTVSDTKSSASIIEHEAIDLTNYIVYRINYSQSLPSEDVLQRAISDSAKDILVKNNLNPDCFVSWAKTGKELPISESSLTELLKKPMIGEIRPLWYEKIMSPDEIQVGDHLFTKNIVDIVVNDYELYNSHFIVVERLTRTLNPVFNVIHFSKGILVEAEHEFNPRIEEGSSQVYRVVYPEEFPGELAVKRTRSLLNKRFLATCASSLMRWAKTGSEEGLEIDFLINNCAPTSKSQIACFTQLNPGDYLIKEVKTFNHHYLVVSIESPTECTVIESWQRKVEEKSLICSSWSDKSTYYRINYDPGQCIPAEHSIEIARDVCSNAGFFSRYWKLNSECARESFVHFVKTGERSVNTEPLQNDRLFLQRELVKSALDLHVGDHIERPLSLAPDHAQHHMLVVEPIDHTTCKVIHFRVEKSITRVLKFKKGDVVSEDVDIFEYGDVFRIVYPERTDPKNGMEKLLGICEGGKTRLQTEIGKIEYHIKDYNCEHLVMLATIGIPLSIQVNQVLRHALVCARGSLRAFRGSVIHHGAECAPKETTAHFMGQACAHSGVKETTRGVVKSGAKSASQASALAMAGGIALAINLAVETPVYIRSIYKLKKKAKFEVISEEEYKRSVIKETLVNFSVVVGGTAGTVAGQATIPVPILGAMVGGLAGGLIGQGSGYLAGEIAGRLIREKKLTLPRTLSYKYKLPLED